MNLVLVHTSKKDYTSGDVADTVAGEPCKPCMIGAVKTGGVGNHQTNVENGFEALVQREVQKYLASLNFSNNRFLNARRFITVKEAAAMLKVSYYTIIDYINSGKLKASKLGNTWRIENIDMDRFISSTTKSK